MKYKNKINFYFSNDMDLFTTCTPYQSGDFMVFIIKETVYDAEEIIYIKSKDIQEIRTTKEKIDDPNQKPTVVR